MLSDHGRESWIAGHSPREPFLQTKLVDQSIHEDIRVQNGRHGLYREGKGAVIVREGKGREGERREERL